MTDRQRRSAKHFRMLLRLLPADFRGDFGSEMEQVFIDQRAEAEREGGKMGVWRLWWETVKGVFTTAPREHLSMLRQDSSFALRMMRKNLGFTVAAIVVLGLGIGANTAIFSVVNAVLLKPLPYAHGERLLMLRERLSRNGPAGHNVSVPEMQDYRRQSRSLDAIVEYHNMQFILLGRAEPQQVETGVVSWNFFDVFGAKPLLGRNFTPDDEKEGAPAVLLLSYDFWLQSFGGDPTVVGKVFRMNDKPHTVVGVLPPFPQYPNENDVYMPSTACPFRSSPAMATHRDHRMVRMFARMKPGVKPAAAEADLSTVGAAMQKEFPTDYPVDPPSVEVTPLKAELTHQAKPTMLLLLAAAGFVLLIACANVANLNLARMVRRERELSVRAAMGASRVRLFRQLLTESALLALVGGGLGLMLASSGLELLASYVARFTPRAHEVHIDATVMIFTLAIALFVSILTGTAPAVARRGNLITTLKEGSTQSTLGASRGKLRSALIVAQVSVSFLLLIGAGLMVRSLINLQRVDPGFHPENVLTIQFSLDFSRYTTNEKTLSFCDALLDKVQAVPGVTSAAMAGVFPLDKSPAFNNQFIIEGEQATNEKRTAELNVISPGYLQVLGIPLLGGRDFQRRDRPESAKAALITQSFAQHYWRNTDPIGRRFSLDEGKTWTQIIGVVGDVHEHGLDQPPTEFIYLPFAQYPQNGPALMVRTAGDPMLVARTAVERLYQVDPNQPAGRIQSLEQYRADSIAAPRLTANLLGLFALLALAIAAAGIGGVMALAVSQRTHEIGVRMAIGARPREIVRMILGQGMGLALIGVMIGLAGAFALTSAVKNFLFEVTPNDPATFVGVAATLAVSALGACYLPARRAAQLDPLRALRTE